MDAVTMEQGGSMSSLRRSKIAANLSYMLKNAMKEHTDKMCAIWEC